MPISRSRLTKINTQAISWDEKLSCLLLTMNSSCFSRGWGLENFDSGGNSVSFRQLDGHLDLAVSEQQMETRGDSKDVLFARFDQPASRQEGASEDDAESSDLKEGYPAPSGIVICISGCVEYKIEHKYGVL